MDGPREARQPIAELLRLHRRTKHLLLVLSAQAMCVAAGIWIHQWYVSAAARDVALEDAWNELADQVREVATEVASVAAAGGDADSDALRRALATTVGFGDLVVVDRNWRVTASPGSGRDMTLPVGVSVPWVPASRVAGNGEMLRGHLEFPAERRLAAAYSLPDASGFVVGHQSFGAIALRGQHLVATLPAASALTFVWTVSLLSITVYLILSRFHDTIARERDQAETRAVRRTESLVRTRDAVVFGLAKLADSRDPETGEHLDRLSIYSTVLSSALRRHPKYADVVTSGFVRLIGISSALHDIGKVGIEDAVLLKPGPLSDAERKRMQEHTTIGAQCLWEIEQRLGSSNFLQMAHQIAQSHHEKWNGQGYPQGLAGENIPLAARIVSIADVYDACSSKRVYKEPFSHERCVEIIREGRGTDFDPDLVDVWLTVEPRFAEIARQYHRSVPSGSPASRASTEDGRAIAAELGAVDSTCA